NHLHERDDAIVFVAMDPGDQRETGSTSSPDDDVNGDAFLSHARCNPARPRGGWCRVYRREWRRRRGEAAKGPPRMIRLAAHAIIRAGGVDTLTHGLPPNE